MRKATGAAEEMCFYIFYEGCNLRCSAKVGEAYIILIPLLEMYESWWRLVSCAGEAPRVVDGPNFSPNSPSTKPTFLLVPSSNLILARFLESLMSRATCHLQIFEHSYRSKMTCQ